MQINGDTTPVRPHCNCHGFTDAWGKSHCLNSWSWQMFVCAIDKYEGRSAADCAV
ncbi:hypothetical protein GCM10009612_72400 [Streptomyces beijiangensis]